MDVTGAHCCPECSSSLVDDAQNGETICSGCGVVVADQMVDHGPEAVGSGLEDKMRLARATGQTTYSQHDLGIATEISMASRDFSGRSIDSEVASQMRRLRKWQPRVRVSSPRERRLANVLSKINETCQGASLPGNVRETAAMVYRGLDGVIDVKGRSVPSMSAAAVYMACKRCGVIRSLDEICRAICPEREVRARARLASRYYREMVMEMGPATAPAVTMDMYISKLANVTKTDVRVERLALELAGKTRNSGLADGKAPNGIAAAYLYVASVLLGQSVLQRDVSGAAGVTEVTIRNRCKEILSCYRIRVALRPSLGAS